MGLKLRPADFARQAGVSKQAVGAKIKNKTLIVDPAGFLDTDHPINAAYISDHGRKPKKSSVIPFPAREAAPGGDMGDGAGGDALPLDPATMTDAEMAEAAAVPATKLLTYTLRDVVVKFGGIYGLEKHAKALQYLTMSADKEQRMAERSLRLIPKDFVTARIFPFLNMLMKQVIEYPEVVADNILSKIMADGPGAREAIIVMMRDGLSRIIAKSKEQAIKELDSLRGRHGLGDETTEEPPPDNEGDGNE